MSLTNFPKAIFYLTLLLYWGSSALPATAQHGVSHVLYQDIVIPAASQTVEVHTPRGSYNAVFLQSEVQVLPNRMAIGSLMLIPAVSHPGGINVLFADGSVRFNRDGTVAGVLLRGRTEDGNRIIVMITPAATEDCLIYTTIGTMLNATWEAQGHILVHRR